MWAEFGKLAIPMREGAELDAPRITTPAQSSQNLKTIPVEIRRLVSPCPKRLL